MRRRPITSGGLKSLHCVSKKWHWCSTL